MCRPGCARQGVVKTKSQTREVRVGEVRGDVRVQDQQPSGNEQVRKEIRNFLLAVHSYPDRFARDPGVTFEEHHGGLVRDASSASRRRV